MGARGHYQVLYDGGCGLCANSVAWLRRLDLQRRLRYADVDADWSALVRAHPSLDRTACLTSMHVIAPDGSVAAGFDGFRTLALVLPLLWPLVPLLHVPGVPPIGRRVYDYLARHRSTTCAISGPRGR